MSDVSRYLPLSQRRREDESHVTSDWRVPFAATLRSLADTLETLPPEQWELVRHVVGQLDWQLTATRLDRASARLRRIEPGLDGRGAGLDGRSTADLVSTLRAIAAADRKRRIRELSVAVVGALDVSYALENAGSTNRVALDPRALGAVAIARSLSAPLPIRAVLGGMTLVATEGDWRVGRGAEREAAASAIVMFLFGRLGVPERQSGDYDKSE